jgi:hypothetical protein
MSVVFLMGDVIDRYCILKVKKENGFDVDYELGEYLKYIQEDVEIRQLSNQEFSELLKIQDELFNCHMAQFALEDRIRVEKDLIDVGKIALEIREFNDFRVLLKNKINILLKEAVIEKKLYKRN